MAQVARSLLEEPVELFQPPPQVDPLPGSISDQRPEPGFDLEAVEPAAGELATAVHEELTAAVDVAVAFVPEPSGSDQATGTSGDGDLVTTAQHVLQRAGLQPLELAQPPTATTAPTVEAALIDRRVVDRPVVAPPIDFTQMALRATMTFKLPEHLDHDFDYHLTVHRPPRQPQHFFQMQMTPRRSLRRLRAMPKDVVLVIDTSASVPQRWIEAVVTGVADALGSLNRQDRFNIVLFNERPRFFSADTIRPYDGAALDEARTFLGGTVSGGYTDVNGALARLLVRDVAAKRVYYLILISDGRPTRGVMDTRELLHRITRDNSLAASIYCVAVGASQNRELLDFLAYRNRGYCLFAARVTEAAGLIGELVSRLRYPILKDVRMDVVGMDGEQVFPRDIPNIHQGQPVDVFGRFDPQEATACTMRVRGTNHSEAFDLTVRRELAGATEGGPRIAQRWAFHKVYHLYSQLYDTADPVPIRRQIERLRRRYRLKTLYN